MQHNEYNGWWNYETWVVNLWMDNEQGSYNYWRQAAREVLANETERAAVNRLADELKDEHEIMLPELDNGFVSDLLNAAMSEVNWHEIAEHLLADVEADAAYKAIDEAEES